MTPEIAVVGAGVSGLAAAFRAQQAGYRPTIFEASDRVGGRTLTEHRDGYIIDRGAGILPSSYENLFRLVADAGLSHMLVPANSTYGFGWSDGRISYLSADHKVRDALTFPLSTKSKLTATKLLIDMLRCRSKLSFEDLSLAESLDFESAGDYSRRRLNAELLRDLVEPAVRGLAGSGADEVSNVDLMFGLAKFMGAKFFAFRDGMGSYAAAMAARFDVKLKTRVSEVKDLGDHVEVHWADDEGDHTQSFAGCVLGVPPDRAAEIHSDMDPWRQQFLRDIRYTKVISIHAALSKPPAGIDGAMLMTSEAVDPGLLMLTFEHLKEPGRAPAGKGLVGVWSTDDWAIEHMDADDDLVIKQLSTSAERVMPGLTNDIEFVTLDRWNQVVLKAPVGHYRKLRRFVELCKSQDKLIQLGGDYFSSASTNTATAGGERATRDLVAVLRARDGQRTTR